MPNQEGGFAIFDKHVRVYATGDPGPIARLPRRDDQNHPHLCLGKMADREKIC